MSFSISSKERTGSSPRAIGAALFAALLIVIVAPSLLRTRNQVLDRGPSSKFAGVVSRLYYDKRGWYLILKRAPQSSTTGNLMEVNVAHEDYFKAAVGDSVFVEVKPGFFGYAWIVSYEVQTAQDRVQELLDRHRTLELRR
jgi:hypothetical protein